MSSPPIPEPATMDSINCQAAATEGVKPPARSVTTLSLEKLYRKRAIDRENQRELRKKNKARLRDMECEVQRLTEKLRESESERARLASQTENHREKIDSVMSILESLRSGQNDVQDPMQHKPLSSPSLLQAKSAASSLPSPAEDLDQVQGVHGTSDLAFGFDNGGLVPDLWSNGGFLTFTTDGSPSVDVNEFSLDINSLAVDGFQPQFNGYGPSDPPETGDQLPNHGGHNSNTFDDARVEVNRIRSNVPIWAIVPVFSQPTCIMDALVLSLVEKRKKFYNMDGNHKEFTNANFPSVSSLLNPILYEPDKPVASTIARHVASVIRVHTTPEKIALLYTMCVLIRWYICPVEENYDAIPDFMRPTGSQLTVPHPVWIGTIGWPKARDLLIRYFDFTTYQSFARAINGSFSINWPHHLNGILEGTPEKGFVLTRMFVEHVRKPANWTVGPGVIDEFPFLKGSMNVR